MTNDDLKKRMERWKRTGNFFSIPGWEIKDEKAYEQILSLIESQPTPDDVREAVVLLEALKESCSRNETPRSDCKDCGVRGNCESGTKTIRKVLGVK